MSSSTTQQPIVRILSLLDRAIPKSVLEDATQQRSAYLLAGLHVMILLVGGLSVLNMALVEQWPQATFGVLVCAFTLGLNYAFRSGSSIAWVVRWTLAMCMIYICWVLWETGGIREGVTASYMVCIPVAALALRGPKRAAFWGLAVVSVFVVFGWIQNQPDLPQPPPADQTSLGSVVFAQSTLLFFFLGMAWFQYSLSELQQEQLQEARQKADDASRAKSSFLANMSHELRTPMNGVLGLTQVLLEDGELSPEQASTLQAIRSSGQSLVALLNDILDFSKIEAGRLELEQVPFTGRQLVEQVFELLGEAARSKELELRLVEKDIGWVMGDPTRIRQVLLNLIGNAIKFTPAGYVEVRVMRYDEMLRFEVQDTGIGIPLEKQGQLWHAFTQADASTTRRFGGTGLGLAISRRLVELMGGGVELHSAPGMGSCFGFSVRAHSCQAPKIEDTKAMFFQLPANMRVLVAEDNLVNQVVARRMLEHFGLDPVIVPNGAEALDKMRQERWDVVLMDCHMPVMDGLEATRTARSEGSEQYIVAMTAGTMPEDRRAAAEAGMDGFVPKPVRMEDLKLLLQELIYMQRAAS